jgi:hypothetical protein
MNLRELNSGTPSTKPWLNPVVKSIQCETINGAEIDSHISGGVFVGTDIFILTNTVAETLINPPSSVGTRLILKEKLTLGATYKIVLSGTISCIAGSQLDFKCYGGLLTDIIYGDLSISNISASTTKPWRLEFELQIHETGGVNVATVTSFAVYQQNTDAGANTPVLQQSSLNNGADATTTQNWNLGISAKWSVANVGNSFLVRHYNITKIF